MKTKLLSTLLAIATLPLLTSSSLQAAKGDQTARPNRAEMIKKFDANGDGKLDQTERQAARNYMQSMRQTRANQGEGQRSDRSGGGRAIARFDTDGDGQLSADERAAAAVTIRENMANNPRAMQRFDLDGDGALSEAEWAQARDQIGERMRQGSRGGKQGGKSKG
jgi:Ca2+-binding EF-hand superfamily protein